MVRINGGVLQNIYLQYLRFRNIVKEMKPLQKGFWLTPLYMISVYMNTDIIFIAWWSWDTTDMGPLLSTRLTFNSDMDKKLHRS